MAQGDDSESLGDDVDGQWDLDDEVDDDPTLLNPMSPELARLADPSSIPHRARRNVGKLLPADASLLWSRIDGRSTLGEILATCAMPEPEALRVLVQLVQNGCLSFDGPASGPVSSGGRSSE